MRTKKKTNEESLIADFTAEAKPKRKYTKRAEITTTTTTTRKYTKRKRNDSENWATITMRGTTFQVPSKWLMKQIVG